MLGSMMKRDLLISDLLVHAGKYHSDTENISKETDGTITTTNWGQVAEGSRRLASALGKLGCAFGDRIATLAWNNVRHLNIWFAVSGSGLVCHTLNPRLFPEQLIFIINDAVDKALFFDKTFMPLVPGIRDHLKSVDHYIFMGSRDDEVLAAVPDTLFYDELIETGDAGYDWPQFSEDTPSSLCYTSGTTGNPKGVLYCHRSTMLHTLIVAQKDTLAISARDVVLPVVPMFHANAWGVPYIAAMCGTTLVMPGPGLDGDSLVDMIDTYKVTFALGVPTIWQMLLASARKKGSKLETLERNVIGGAAAPSSMIIEFRDEYNCETLHGWGMTEMSPLGTLNQTKAKHADLTTEEMVNLCLGQGRPPFGVDLRLVDEEGNVLPHDGETQGALQVKGHWIVETYYGKDADNLTEDGWFDTGDVATVDADGFMIIRDRTKDIIKSGGEWISSVELEGTAMGTAGIAMAAVIGVRHPKWDERPLVIAVRAESANVSEADVLAQYEGTIAKWQIPEKVIFADAIPISGTGKMLKVELRETYADAYMMEGA